MLAGIGFALWFVGVWFTYIAFNDMGVSSPFITALIVQALFTVSESVLTTEKYRMLPETQKKVVLVFSIAFMACDIWFNYRGISPNMGNVSMVLPDSMREDVQLTNTVIAVFLSAATAILPEIFITTHRSMSNRSIRPS
jgi:hypothetical protein